MQIGLRVSRAELDRRIAVRVARMWQAGLVDEVRGLEQAGLREGRTASQALGYAQVLGFLAGEWSEDEARDQTVKATRRFARRQESWFRRDPRVIWLDAGPGTDLAGPGTGYHRAMPVAQGPLTEHQFSEHEFSAPSAAQFAKGHGTENDFVILPDPRGEHELSPDLAARLCDRRAGIGADGVLRVVRTAAGPAARSRRTGPSGSWTTGTRTAASPRCAATGSACSPATCWTHGLAAGAGVRGGHPVRRRARSGRSRTAGSPWTWARPACSAPAGP